MVLMRFIAFSNYLRVYILRFYSSERISYTQASEMNGEDLSIASSDDMPQTMMEIDYETVIDDDAVDEFTTFKGLLEGVINKL